MREIDLPSAEATSRLGEALGRRARPGTFVALIGDLGAGKTVFARGVGRGLGVTTRVQSPTFVIVQGHEGGRLPLWHADWYRLADPGELDELGVADVADRGVLVVEWADRFPERLPDDHLEVRIDERGDGRVARVRATGPLHAELEGIVDDAR